METELVLWWDGVERLRFSVRSNDGKIIQTNRRAKPLRVPRGAEIKLPDGELVGTVDRVTGAGANRYELHYTAAPKKKKRTRKKKKPPELPPAEPDAEADDLLATAEALESDLATVLEPEGEAEDL